MMKELIEREAALKAIDPGYGDFHSGNYNAIRALPAAQVTVKPLVWAAGDDPDNLTTGDYDIYHEGHGYQLYFWSIVLGEPHSTIFAAEQSAWVHHDARIRAALDVAPVSLAEAARVLLHNMPGEHECWAALQDAVDAGQDEDDCIRVWLGSIAGEQP